LKTFLASLTLILLILASPTLVYGKIAFVTIRDGNEEIYVMDDDGSNPRNITQNPANDNEPSWSPDGKKIAFNSDRDGNWEVYVMNADSSNPVNLTNNSNLDGSPHWSPDGHQITFTSNRNGDLEIYVMSSDGQNVRKLTETDGLRKLIAYSTIS